MRNSVNHFKERLPHHRFIDGLIRLSRFRVTLAGLLADQFFGILGGIGGGCELFDARLAGGADPTVGDRDVGSLNRDFPKLVTAAVSKLKSSFQSGRG